MKKKKLVLDQLEVKIKAFSAAANVASPPAGWIKSVRLALGMSLQQLGSRLSVTKQNVHEMEKREKNGSITITSLRETAAALDMELIYAFVPKDGSLDNLVDRRARELATKIVSRTSNTMKLEDQENSKDRIQKAIEERTEKLKQEMPKVLWD